MSRPRVTTVVATVVFVAAMVLYLVTEHDPDNGSLPPPKPAAVWVVDS